MNAILKQPKLTIIIGWPPIEFKFTGKWDRQETGGVRGARRNKRMIDVPIYKNDAGVFVEDMQQQRIVKHSKVKVKGITDVENR